MKLSSKIRSSNFIGKQLSRFKMGMGYYTLAMSTITAAMLLKTNYDIQIEWIIAFVPVLFLATIFLGYLLDTLNINTQDLRKSNEMTHRFLLKSDRKNQEFQLMQTRFLVEALQALKEGKDIDLSVLDEKYHQYQKDWKAPSD
ncbi:MAG: hypothetical protein KAR20_06455 [Candidatus Heimdallarchaeota archaeon]|nr:hypothetical protein [Candidatus Heimdallarchaeota archaeon]